MKQAVFCVIILLFFNCTEQSNESTKGILKGKISIGPICPVETDPPLPGCKATLETYKAYQTAVWKSNKKNYLVKIEPDIDGNFQTELPEGEYYIDFEDKRVVRIGGANFPLEFKISNAHTTNLDIHIDTGIR
jgi:hypothetical protein